MWGQILSQRTLVLSKGSQASRAGATYSVADASAVKAKIFSPVAFPADTLPMSCALQRQGWVSKRLETPIVRCKWSKKALERQG